MFLLKKLLNKIWREVILGKREADESGRISNPLVARAKFIAFIVLVVAIIVVIKRVQIYKAEKKAEAERVAAEQAAEQAAIEAETEYKGLPIPENNEEAWSLVYDRNYYVTANPDIKEYYGDQPEEWFKHFTMYGLKEARVGNELFNPVYYRENNPDLSDAYGDDFRCYYYHFINYGYKEGRKGSE